MLNRVAEIKSLSVIYGSNKGSIQAGDTTLSMFQGGNGNSYYSSSEIDSEIINNSGTTLEGNLSWTPVIPSSVSILIGADVFFDDGKGNVVPNSSASIKITSGKIDYHTGEYSLTLDSDPSSNNVTVSFSYSYDNISTPVQAPEIELKIQSTPVIANSRKLKTIYSVDAAFDLSQDFGMKMDEELAIYTAAEIKHEIDGEIMSDLLNIASSKSTTWSKVAPTGVSLRDHYESFWNKIVEAGNNIFEATRLARASWVIVGMEAANVVETHPRFVSAGNGNAKGPYLVGHLNDVAIYKNPFFPSDEYLVGWKGDSLLEAGYVYAPYMPIIGTQLLTDENFQGKRGFATSYGKKPINSKFYSKGQII